MATQSFLNFLKPKPITGLQPSQQPQPLTGGPAAPANPYVAPPAKQMGSTPGGGGNPFASYPGGNYPGNGTTIPAGFDALTQYGMPYVSGNFKGEPGIVPVTEGYASDPNLHDIFAPPSGGRWGSGQDWITAAQTSPQKGLTSEMRQALAAFGTLNLDNADFYHSLSVTPGMSIDDFAAANGITGATNQSWILNMYNNAMDMVNGNNAYGLAEGYTGGGGAGGPGGGDTTGFAGPSNLVSSLTAGPYGGVPYDPANSGQGGFGGGQGGKRNPGLGKNNKVKIKKAGGGGGNPGRGAESSNPQPARMPQKPSNNTTNRSGGGNNKVGGNTKKKRK